MKARKTNSRVEDQVIKDIDRRFRKTTIKHPRQPNVRVVKRNESGQMVDIKN